MGFFANLGNYLVEGVFFNLISSIIGFIVLFVIGSAFIGLFNAINENQIFEGLFTSQSDNPLKVAMICFFTPIVCVGLLGFVFGYLWSIVELFGYFFWNIIPFIDWGDKDGTIILGKLWYNLVDIPVWIFSVITVGIFSTPFLTLIVIVIFCFLSFGILWPSGSNRGSISSTNVEYAAISFSSFILIIGVVATLFFGGIFSAIAEWKYDDGDYETDDFSQPYFISDPLESPDLTYAEQSEKVIFNLSEQVVLFECNSLNSMYDDSDNFVYNPTNTNPSQNYHVMIKSTDELEFYSAGADGYETSLNINYSDFYTSQVNNMFGDSQQFILRIPEDDSQSEIEEFSYLKYHIAYIAITNGSQNNSSAMLLDAIDDAGAPSTCGVLSFGGSLESRVRATSLGFLVAGSFLLGCCINRFYIVSGGHGTTSQRTMTRAFLFSQGISYTVAIILIILFDPLDGRGITGVSTEQLIEWGISIATFVVFVIGLLAVLIFAIVLYRQRHLIGEIIEVGGARIVDKYEDAQTGRDIDDWFD